MTEQDAVASAMQASCQAGHTGPGRQGQTQCSKWTRYDEAVAALTLAATAGQFAQPGSPAAGRCYGRLCNIVRVRQSGMTRAANAAVAELVNLGTCVFVSDRQMANTVGADEGAGMVAVRMLPAASCILCDQLALLLVQRHPAALFCEAWMGAPWWVISWCTRLNASSNQRAKQEVACLGNTVCHLCGGCHQTD